MWPHEHGCEQATAEEPVDTEVATNIKKPKEHLHEESLASMAVLHKERIAMNKDLAELLAIFNAKRVLRLQLSDQIAQHEANLAQSNAELELGRMGEEEDTAIVGAPSGATCLLYPGDKPMIRYVHDTTKGNNVMDCIECHGEFGQSDYIFSCYEPIHEAGGCGHSLCSSCHTTTCKAVAS